MYMSIKIPGKEAVVLQNTDRVSSVNQARENSLINEQVKVILDARGGDVDAIIYLSDSNTRKLLFTKHLNGDWKEAYPEHFRFTVTHTVVDPTPKVYDVEAVDLATAEKILADLIKTEQPRTRHSWATSTIEDLRREFCQFMQSLKGKPHNATCDARQAFLDKVQGHPAMVIKDGKLGDYMLKIIDRLQASILDRSGHQVNSGKIEDMKFNMEMMHLGKGMHDRTIPGGTLEELRAEFSTLAVPERAAFFTKYRNHPALTPVNGILGECRIARHSGTHRDHWVVRWAAYFHNSDDFDTEQEAMETIITEHMQVPSEPD